MRTGVPKTKFCRVTGGLTEMNVPSIDIDWINSLNTISERKYRIAISLSAIAVSQCFSKGKTKLVRVVLM